LDKFSIIFFFKSVIFLSDDFVADVGKRVGKCVDKSTENLIDFDRNWVDEFEQCTDMEILQEKFG